MDVATQSEVETIGDRPGLSVSGIACGELALIFRYFLSEFPLAARTRAGELLVRASDGAHTCPIQKPEMLYLQKTRSFVLT